MQRSENVLRIQDIKRAGDGFAVLRSANSDAPENDEMAQRLTQLHRAQRRVLTRGFGSKDKVTLPIVTTAQIKLNARRFAGNSLGVALQAIETVPQTDENRTLTVVGATMQTDGRLLRIVGELDAASQQALSEERRLVFQALSGLNRRANFRWPPIPDGVNLGSVREPSTIDTEVIRATLDEIFAEPTQVVFNPVHVLLDNLDVPTTSALPNAQPAS